MIIKATVTTNCEDDKYLRVKVKNTQFWPKESSLLSSEEFRIVTDDGTSVTLVNDKFTIATKSGLEITSDGAKYSIKNESVDFKTIFDAFLESLLTTAPTTQGSPAAQNFNPQIILDMNEFKTKLGQLFK